MGQWDLTDLTLPGYRLSCQPDYRLSCKSSIILVSWRKIASGISNPGCEFSGVGSDPIATHKVTRIPFRLMSHPLISPFIPSHQSINPISHLRAVCNIQPNTAYRNTVYRKEMVAVPISLSVTYRLMRFKITVPLQLANNFIFYLFYGAIFLRFADLSLAVAKVNFFFDMQDGSAIVQSTKYKSR